MLLPTVHCLCKEPPAYSGIPLIDRRYCFEGRAGERSLRRGPSSYLGETFGSTWQTIGEPNTCNKLCEGVSRNAGEPMAPAATRARAVRCSLATRAADSRHPTNSRAVREFTLAHSERRSITRLSPRHFASPGLLHRGDRSGFLARGCSQRYSP